MKPDDLSEDGLPTPLTSIKLKNLNDDVVSNNGNDLWQKGICLLLLIVIIVWCFTILAVTVIIVVISKNPLNASLFPPLLSPVYLFYRILHPLLPMNEQKFWLAAMRPRIVIFGKREKSEN